jgi:hypothetical protein
MKRLFAFASGFAAGFVVGSYLAKTDPAESFLATLKGKFDDAQEAFMAGFQERTGELQDAIDDLKSDLKSES